jgi:hypothetical protein
MVSNDEMDPTRPLGVHQPAVAILPERMASCEAAAKALNYRRPSGKVNQRI